MVPPLAQPWREDNYTWDGPKAWACFRPNADVLVPMYYDYSAKDIVSPFAGPRSITALMRFAYQIGDGKNLVEHYGHRLRYELIEYWKANPLEGSQQGLRSVEVGCLTNPASAPRHCLQALQKASASMQSTCRGCMMVVLHL
jgi:hypothetical protein